MGEGDGDALLEASVDGWLLGEDDEKARIRLTVIAPDGRATTVGEAEIEAGEYRLVRAGEE